MSHKADINRRTFIKLTGLSGGGLVLAATLPGFAHAAAGQTGTPAVDAESVPINFD